MTEIQKLEEQLSKIELSSGYMYCQSPSAQALQKQITELREAEIEAMRYVKKESK
jgi:hypothetical protein